jgi:hypothetical protein
LGVLALFFASGIDVLHPDLLELIAKPAAAPAGGTPFGA